MEDFNLPYEFKPGEMEKTQEQMKRYQTEVMRLAALMKLARDCQKNGDTMKSQIYAFTISTTLGMKSSEEMMGLSAAAIDLVSQLAEKVTDQMATGVAEAMEKMLREGNT